MARKADAQQALATRPAEPTSIAPAHTLTPGQMATLLIEKENFDVEKLGQLMMLQKQHEDDEARKAYIQALTLFRSKCPTIARTRTVHFESQKGVTNYTHAGLAETMEQIQELLGECQLSVTWAMLRDEPNWIQVECRLSHIGGHTERTTLGGPPDTSGSKNALQARASTVSYLERYTLKALLGLVDRDMPDNDGADGAAAKEEPPPPPPSKAALEDDDAKRAFADACLSHLAKGIKPKPSEYKVWLAQTQQVSGMSAIRDCAAWLREHGCIEGGKVKLKAPTAQDAAPPEQVQTWEETDDKPFVCEKCGVLYRVKPARGLCVADDADGFMCKGKIIERT